MKKLVLKRLRANELKVVVTGSTALYKLGHSTSKPKDLDLLVTVDDSENVCLILQTLGFKESLHFQDPKGFQLWKQYKLEDNKIDLFLVDEKFADYTKVGKSLYANPAIIWAARGFYAANGVKQRQQLKDAGFWFGKTGATYPVEKAKALREEYLNGYGYGHGMKEKRKEVVTTPAKRSIWQILLGRTNKK